MAIFKEYYEYAIIFLAIISAIFVRGKFFLKNKNKNTTDENRSLPESDEKSLPDEHPIQKNESTERKNQSSTMQKDSNTLIYNREEIKLNKKILFIDDTPYPITKLMKKNGWMHVSLVSEIDSFECNEVVSADVILVDIIGVGRNLGFQDQGYGLAEALKETYPEKKIIIYSQEENKFHKAIKTVDLTIQKTSNIYELEKEILSLFGVN